MKIVANFDDGNIIITLVDRFTNTNDAYSVGKWLNLIFLRPLRINMPEKNVSFSLIFFQNREENILMPKK